MPSPVTETVVLAIVIAFTLMVLGLVTIIRLIRGDKSFYLDFKGFGSELKMGRHNLTKEVQDEPTVH